MKHKGTRMNGRIHSDDTPEARLAAVAKSLCTQMAERHSKTHAGPKEPDYADFREAFRPFILRELINARIDEARKVSGRVLTQRIRELAEELQNIKFPDEFNL